MANRIPVVPQAHDLRELLVRMGSAMAAAGESVDSIRSNLVEICDAFGAHDIELVVLPTALFIQTGSGTQTHLQVGSDVVRPMRFDQIDELYHIMHLARHRELTVDSALKRLDAMEAMKPRYPRLIRIFGHGVVAAALSLLLQPSWQGVAICLALGIGIRIMRSFQLSVIQSVAPVLAAFAVSLIVFGFVDNLAGENPLRILIPPLATFLPGAMLTTGTVELAAGQMISGASRLVAGLVQLGLLAFGIVAAYAVIALPAEALLDQPTSTLGWWAPWLGTVVLGVGYTLQQSSPPRALPYIIVVLLVTYAGQSFGASIFGAELSGFFGAAAMAPTVLAIERLRNGPPALVTFLPGFWLLVPGAAGLIGVTQIVGVDAELGIQALNSALVSVMSIALGVLLGTALFRAAREVGARAQLPVGSQS